MNFTYRMQHVVLRGDLKKPLDLIAEATSPRHHNVLRNKGCKLKECG